MDLDRNPVEVCCRFKQLPGLRAKHSTAGNVLSHYHVHLHHRLRVAVAVFEQHRRRHSRRRPLAEPRTLPARPSVADAAIDGLSRCPPRHRSKVLGVSCTQMLRGPAGVLTKRVRFVMVA